MNANTTATFSAWMERLLEAPVEAREALLVRAEAERAGLRQKLEEALAVDAEHATRALDMLRDRVPVDATPMPDRSFGRYELVAREPVGAGGMGEVYRVHDPERPDLGELALKVLRDASPRFRRRFEREKDILVGLEHPNIARLVDAGESSDGHPYFVMEYVDGVPLDTYAEDLTVRQKIELVLQLCSAVTACHDRGVIHRDLKPSNVLVRANGSPMLLDFGIAKTGEDLEVTRTMDRMISGGYGSPEQVFGQPATVRSDVYGLGALLYRLFNGGLPFPSETIDEWWQAIQNEEPRSLIYGLEERPALRKQLAGELEWIVDKALRKEPGRRYSNVDALARDLENHLSGRPVEAAPESQAYRARKWVRRHRIAVAATIAVFGATVLSAGVFYTQRNKAQDAEARKELIVQSYRDLFRLSEAGGDIPVERFVEHGVDVMERMQGDRQAQAQLAATLGVIHRELASFEDAERLLRDALPDLSQERAIEAKTELAWTLYRLDRHDEASQLLWDALETCELEASPCAATLNVLGMVHVELDELDVADKLLNRAITAAVLEEDPYQEAEGTTNLSVLRVEQNRMEESIVLAGRSLELRRELFGPTHLLTAEAQNNLGNAVGQNGELERAEELLSRAQATQSDFLGENHPNTLQSLNGLAQSVRFQGDRLGDSVPFFRRAANGYEQVFGASHARTLSTKQNLALVLLELDRLDEAEGLLAGILKSRREGSSPGDLGKTLIAWGDLLLRRERDAPAEEVLREASEVLGGSLGADSRHTWRARVLHGLASYRTGEPPTAACSAYSSRPKDTKPTHPTAVSLSQRLAAQQINCTTEGS